MQVRARAGGGLTDRGGNTMAADLFTCSGGFAVSRSLPFGASAGINGITTGTRA